MSIDEGTPPTHANPEIDMSLDEGTPPTLANPGIHMSLDEGTPPTNANPGIDMSIDEGTSPTHVNPETNMFCFSNLLNKKATNEDVLKLMKSLFEECYKGGGEEAALHVWFGIDDYECAYAFLEKKCEAIKTIKINKPKLPKGRNQYGQNLSKNRDDFLSGELKKGVMLLTDCKMRASFIKAIFAFKTKQLPKRTRDQKLETNGGNSDLERNVIISISDQVKINEFLQKYNCTMEAVYQDGTLTDAVFSFDYKGVTYIIFLQFKTSQGDRVPNVSGKFKYTFNQLLKKDKSAKYVGISTICVAVDKTDVSKSLYSMVSTDGKNIKKDNFGFSPPTDFSTFDVSKYGFDFINETPIESLINIVNISIQQIDGGTTPYSPFVFQLDKNKAYQLYENVNMSKEFLMAELFNMCFPGKYYLSYHGDQASKADRLLKIIIEIIKYELTQLKHVSYHSADNGSYSTPDFGCSAGMINGKRTYTLYSKDDFAYSLFASINITDGTIQFWLIPTKDMLKHCKNVFKEHNDKKEGCATVVLWPKDAPPPKQAAQSGRNDWQWTRDFQLGGKFPFPSRDDFEKYNQANPDSPLRLSFDDMNDMLAKIKEWDEEKNAKKKGDEKEEEDGGGGGCRSQGGVRGRLGQREMGRSPSEPRCRELGRSPQRAPLMNVANPAPLARAAGGKERERERERERVARSPPHPTPAHKKKSVCQSDATSPPDLFRIGGEVRWPATVFFQVAKLKKNFCP